MRISGTTRILPIIGHPVDSVFSPPAFNSYFESNDMDCVMVPLDVPPNALASFWDLLRHSDNLLGCSITFPHKQAAFAAVDKTTPRAARLGALNTIRSDAGRLVGDATDGLAMCAAIAATGKEIKGMSARVLGAGGGAGIAIVDALCDNGVRHLTIVETNGDRLRFVLAFVARYWPDVQINNETRPAEILINATTLGKSKQDACPFDDQAIKCANIICDAVPSSTGTTLTSNAQAHGKLVVTGDDMGRNQLNAQLSFVGLIPAE